MSARVSREWATPLAIGLFALMSVTGTLMFFHLDTGLQKAVHEWAGWAMLAAVALHAAANWPGFKRYFKLGQRGAAVLGVCALVIVGSFFVRGAGEGQGGGSPPALAINALAQAPIAQVAPLFGKSGAQARAELAAAGIALADDQASLAGALGGQREKIGLALRTLAQRGG